MLNRHYTDLEQVSRQEVETVLQRGHLSHQQRRHYLCHVIEARAYHIFKQDPTALCEALTRNDLDHYIQLLAQEQDLAICGCLCPEAAAAPLRRGPFPDLYHAIADWPVEQMAKTVGAELKQARLRGGASTREPIYTGDWWSINLFDSSLEQPCPAARLFPETLKLLLQTEAMQRSLKLLQQGGHHKPALIARLSCIGPQSRIEPHFGVNLWKTRIHLPIQIPDRDCFITGYNEQQQWRPHHTLILDDTYLHAVVNASEEPRIVLLVDIIHPAIDNQRWSELQSWQAS